MDYWEKANHSWSTDSLRYINTSTQKQRELFYYIQEIGYFKASKPYFTERENLPSYLIKYTLSGCGELRYKGKSYQLKAGDVFFIDCLDYQYYRTVSQEPWEMDWIHLYGANVAAFYEEFFKNGSPVFHTNPASSRQNPIHLVLQDLLMLQPEPNAKTAFQSSVLIHQLLNELLLQKYHLDFSDSEIPPYILQIRDQLEEDFRQGITLESLEERYHINKYQIVKEFSKYMGLPPSSTRSANASLIRKTFCAILAFPSKRSHWRSASKTPSISAVYSRKKSAFHLVIIDRRRMDGKKET